MAANFVGVWNLTDSNNFDKYMQEVGVSAPMAKMGNMAKPTLTISVEGDTWKLKSETTFKTAKAEFKLGEEFVETTADERKMNTTFTLETPTKLVQDQKGAIPSVIVRELVDGKMLVTCTAGKVVATRTYVKKT
jgi:hypothetical protein